jgi:hypothetical protein
VTSRRRRRRLRHGADPPVLKARIDLRVYQLKQLAAWTVANCRGRVEREQLLRGLPPLPVRRDEDDDE